MPDLEGIDMASIQARKRTNGTPIFRVQFRLDKRMRSRSFGTIKAAKEFAALVDRVGPVAALDVLDARENNDGNVPTFRDWVETYLDEASGYITGIQQGTRNGYKRIANNSFLPILGDIPVDAITKADIGRWLAWQEAQDSGRTAGKKVAAKTVHNYHALLSSTLSAAIEAKYRTDNPAKGVRITRGQKHEAAFLSRDEFATLLHFIPSYHKPLVLFLVGTGARWSEATALEKRDVNTDATPATVRIVKAWKKGNVIGPPKSPKSNRTVSLWPEIIAELSLTGDGFLFQGEQNSSRVWYGPFKSRVWDRAVAKATDREACAQAGLTPLTRRPTPHDLRHTHASWLIAAGAPLPFVQARLGHEKITTTVDTYGHLLPDAHVQMSAIMQETMAGVLPSIER